MTAHYRLNGVLLCGSDFAGTRAFTVAAGYKMENEWLRENLGRCYFAPTRAFVLGLSPLLAIVGFVSHKTL